MEDKNSKIITGAGVYALATAAAVAEAERSAIVAMTPTRAGMKLYGKLQAGLATLEVTRVVIGDGELNGADIYDLEALKNEVDVATQIIGYEQVGDGQLKLTFRITGTKDFYLREIGVIAKDPDDGEILGWYCNYGKYADYVMTYAGSITVTQEADIYFAIGAASEINISVNRDTAGVTHLELEAHTNNQENPHNVTAAQVFPKNSETLAAITEQDKKSYDAAASDRHTHANGGILAVITQALINAWNNAVSHITNTANPHNVTKSQVGLGNVTNESKATMFKDPTFTGTPKAPTAPRGTSTTQIATTEFVQSAINSLASNIFDATYAVLFINKNDYNVLNDEDDTSVQISYTEWNNGIYEKGIMYLTDSKYLPVSSDLPIFFTSITSDNDDEVANHQLLLYSNGTVYRRTRYLWDYIGGVARNPRFGEWELEEWHWYKDYFKRK